MDPMDLKLHAAHNIKTVDPTLLDLIQMKKNEEALHILQNINSDDLKGEMGMELLHFAAYINNDVVTQNLIKLGVYIDVLDKLKNTPLMTALLSEKDEKTIKVLLDWNANIYYVKQRQNLLSKVIFSTFKDWSIKKLFIDRFKSDWSDNSDIAAEKLLFMNIRFPHAVHFRDVQILKSMLSQGCSISDSAPNNNNKTALHEAVVVKDLEIIKFLLLNGANINAVDLRGMIPFTLAYDYDDSAEEYEILNYLLDKGSALNLLIAHDHDQKAYILTYGKTAIIRTLLSRGNTDFNTRGRLGRTYLHYIASNNKICDNQDIIEHLKQYEIDVNILSNDNGSPLHIALSRRNFKLALFLVKRGANVNHQNTKKQTALHLSIGDSWYADVSTSERKIAHDIVELLLQRGADPQLLTNDNHTVLDYIGISERFDLLKPILGHLVLHVDRGGVIINEISHLINLFSTFKVEFELCQRDCEEIKTIRFNDSLTAFNVIFDSEKKIMLCARKKEVFDKLTKFYSTISSNSYFYDLLKRRLENILPSIEIRFQAIESLCCILKFDYYAIPSVIDKIIDYFDNQDLQNVIQV